MAEFPVSRFAFPVAAHIITDDLIVSGEKRELVFPLAAIRHPGMNHDEGCTLTGRFVIELCVPIIYKSRFCWKGRHVISPFRQVNTFSHQSWTNFQRLFGSHFRLPKSWIINDKTRSIDFEISDELTASAFILIRSFA